MSQNHSGHFQSKPLRVEERYAAGKALRIKYPRASHGDYKPAINRPDPVSVLEEQAKTRLTNLLPIRYGRMLESPFAFLRGGAAIMASDLASSDETTGIRVQTCGDMHVANFGLYASPERNLIFGINDFDETIPGPWEWDLKRLVASIVASCKYLGGDEKLSGQSVIAAVKSYRNRMKEFAQMGHLELWYSTIKEKDILKALPNSIIEEAKKITAKARTRSQIQVLAKITDMVDNQHQIKVNPPYIVRETETLTGRTINDAVSLFLDEYIKSLADDKKEILKRYSILDVVRKVVGVGSVGTRCWVVLLQGNDEEDPLFLQIKEANPSVLEPNVAKSLYSNQGERVVAGQRLIQSSTDIFLGWFRADGIDFYVRQLRDMKGGLKFEPNKFNIKNFPFYTELCGWALALAHAKSGDAAMLSGYTGSSDELDNAMVRFAYEYDKQTESDYKALVLAAKNGRIKLAKEIK
ncbi:MAG: DUF2252 domain-containing protein [Bacteroidales bacterium]